MSALDMHNIPADISDMLQFSSFNILNTEYTFMPIIRFSKNVDFYKTTRMFDSIEFDHNRTSLINLINKNANRVTPLLEEKKDESTIDFIIANELCEKASEYSNGGTYQFYRIIFVFDSLYNVPQTCCCGLFGFTNYELYKKGKNMNQVMRRTVTENSGALKNQHTCFIPMNTKDTLKTHGEKLATLLS